MKRHWPEMRQRIEEIAYDPLVALNNVKWERIKGPMKFSAIVEDSSNEDRICYYMRPEFHAMLLDQLSSIGLKVEFGNGVVDYFEDAPNDRAGVVLEDGSRLDADLVVAADGIRTASGPLVAGQPVPATSSGHAVFRVAYPVELALADPMIAERFKLDESGQSVLEMFFGSVSHQLFSSVIPTNIPLQTRYVWDLLEKRQVDELGN